MVPIVSVVIVSDYSSGEEKGWDDLRETLKSLARQNFEEPVEYLLMESSAFASRIPVDLMQVLPGLRVVFADARSSYALKNEGAKIAQADIVGVLDGDCAPAPGWLHRLVATFRDHPEAAVVSGRTIYDSHDPRERAIGLLSRGYLDRGQAGWTDAIANNNAAFRRDALLAHRFFDDVGPFGGKLQGESMRRAGLKMYFEPGMLVTHAYEGWSMERDIRLNAGYATIMVRRIDSRIAFSWMASLGYLAVPLFVAARTACSFWALAKLWRYYGLPWHFLPSGFALAIGLHLMEIPGMVVALRGGRLAETAYR